jgi:putative heme-binding domain-containing protein
MQGSFGIVDARIIAPGDPEGSVLYYRMAKLGGGRMPRVGSAIVDESGVDLIHDWIASLPRPQGASRPAPAAADQAAMARLRDRARSTPESRAEAIRGLVDSTRGGLELMHLIGHGEPALAGEVWSVLKESGKAEVKDLFERFVPESERARRLGDRIEPTAVLALRGDARRGSRLFSASTTLCANCHRVGGQGVELGPDLDAIGSKYDRTALLRQVLEPSIVVDSKYVNYLLETKAGVAHSGMLAGKSDREVVLRDAKNQTIKVPAAEVESLVPQQKSLMPDALLRDLTAQEAADLLEYLGSLRGPDRPTGPK